MIPDFEISKCSEFKVKSKIGKIFKNHNFIKEYSARIYKIDPHFYKHCGKKQQVDKNGQKYILFRIDIYFSEYSLAVKIDEKGHTDRDFIFEEKRQKALEKKLGCKFIRINTSNVKNGCDLDYKIGNIEAFIDELKNKKIKELEKEIREMRNEKWEIKK